MDVRPLSLRPWVLALVLVACGSATSCATTALWGGSIEEDEDGSHSIRTSGGTPLHDSLCVKILATPFTLAFDLCTYPLQAWLFGWDDDEEDDC